MRFHKILSVNIDKYVYKYVETVLWLSTTTGIACLRYSIRKDLPEVGKYVGTHSCVCRNVVDESNVGWKVRHRSEI